MTDEAISPAAGWLSRFDSFAERFVAKHDLPGAAVAIVKDGEVAYRRAFGLRDVAAEAPTTSTTLFGVASLTKSFTALTLLVLEARGALRLSDPVTRYLPEFTYPGLEGRSEPVRLWHLASHSSGLPPLRGLDYAIRPSQRGDPAAEFNRRDYRNAPEIDDYQQLLAYLRVGERSALPGPGEVASYSNEGFALLGAVIEAATGRYYPDVVAEAVLEPLGMSSATFDTGAAAASGELTELYTRTPAGEVIHSPRWEEAPAYLGTGFLKASVEGLAAYLNYLLRPDGRLGVSAESLQQLTRPRVWAEPGASYGLGWSLRADHHGLRHGVEVARHGGSLKGVSAHQGFAPRLGLGIAVLTNLDEAPVKRLWAAALNAYLGLELSTATYPTPPATRLSAAAVSGLAGVYASGEPWGRLELRVGAEGELLAFTGEDAEVGGRVAMLNGREFVLVGENGAWDGGRFHFGLGGPWRAEAVQFGLRWYDRA